jgi:hypothetical protein
VRALPHLTLRDLRVFAALLVLLPFYDRSGDHVAVRAIAALVYGRENDHVSGWERDRVAESLRRLAARGVIEYTPGRGRHALAFVSFPAPPEHEPEQLGLEHEPNQLGLEENTSRSGRETPADSVAKHEPPRGHTEVLTEVFSEVHANPEKNTSKSDDLEVPESVRHLQAVSPPETWTGDAEASVVRLRRHDEDESREHMAEARRRVQGSAEDKLVTRALAHFAKHGAQRPAVEACINELRHRYNIADELIDVAVGQAISTDARKLAYLTKVACDFYRQRTGTFPR